jgi:hypothetical protein
MGITAYISIVFCLTLSILGILFFNKGQKPSSSSLYFFTIPSIIFAVLAMSTSWIWLYYFCLYISLPALLISIISGFMVYKIDNNNRMLKIIVGLQIVAVVLSIMGAFFFNII